jgi:hypothetical protein
MWEVGRRPPSEGLQRGEGLAAAATLIAAIRGRIQEALESPVAKDSPLFQLFDRFPGIEISHELTDVFRDRVQYAAEFRNRLAKGGLAK